MEKRIIIDFLNDHWEEFAALLSEAADTAAARIFAEHFPDDFYEFAVLLSKILSTYRTQCPDTRLPPASHTDTKGLLERAQQFRKNDSPNADGSHSSIIVKNGLFVIQPQEYTEALDTSFKKLVDSVL